MVNDLDSYLRHDKVYKTLDYSEISKRMERLKKENFEFFGFQLAMDKNPEVRSLHIDIGSGSGWLINKTASVFEKVIAIEPSLAAIETSKLYNQNFSNIEHLNLDMVEALKALEIKAPCFITTSVVFSHIKDYHVENALSLINNLPVGSVLLFCEPYDKNIQEPFWYLRSREWWAEKLPNWELNFLGYRGIWNGKKEKYKKSIYGVRVNNKPEVSARGFFRSITWKIEGIYFKIRYFLVRIIKKLLGIKDKIF